MAAGIDDSAPLTTARTLRPTLGWSFMTAAMRSKTAALASDAMHEGVIDQQTLASVHATSSGWNSGSLSMSTSASRAAGPIVSLSLSSCASAAASAPALGWCRGGVGGGSALGGAHSAGCNGGGEPRGARKGASTGSEGGNELASLYCRVWRRVKARSRTGGERPCRVRECRVEHIHPVAHRSMQPAGARSAHFARSPHDGLEPAQHLVDPRRIIGWGERHWRGYQRWRRYGGVQGRRRRRTHFTGAAAQRFDRQNGLRNLGDCLREHSPFERDRRRLR
mmetsp:Transcript_35071/g.112959  ORF Transcript_35071/g.112959 Transcript_35071/m.112959 type:complete len:279 (+) Transcript_35071:761-1597(+)